MLECRIVVATRKPYWMPEDPLYLPLHVGSAGEADIGYARDDGGENISAENPWYCELTGLYWAWKNLQAGYIGLTHYRRHFALFRPLLPAGLERRKHCLLAGSGLMPLLAKSPIILPRPRRYYIESKESQFVHAHGPEPILALRRVMGEYFPEWEKSFEDSMRRSWGHIANMSIMRRDILDEYCSWLFAVLEKTAAELRRSGHLKPRILGHLGERLLDVWLEAGGRSWLELPVIMLERVNWPRKIAAFLGRKFTQRV
jgi:hypothetical protein